MREERIQERTTKTTTQEEEEEEKKPFLQMEAGNQQCGPPVLVVKMEED
jgi:hypothetical protein